MRGDIMRGLSVGETKVKLFICNKIIKISLLMN